MYGLLMQPSLVVGARCLGIGSWSLSRKSSSSLSVMSFIFELFLVICFGKLARCFGKLVALCIDQPVVLGSDVDVDLLNCWRK